MPGLWSPLSNTLIVDSAFGNDSNGAKNGPPFRTIQAAVAVASSGDCICLHPGTHTLTAGVTLPTGVNLVSLSLYSVTVQMLNVTADTTLLTMGEGCAVENVSFNLTSTQHRTLKGVVFPGTTSATAKLRLVNITVDNSGAGDGGTSNVYGIHHTGSGAPNDSTNAVRNSTVVVNSAGLGNKRGILCDSASAGNEISFRDTNVRVSRTGAAAGSYIGIETNHANASISFRTGAVNSAVTADISQTAGTIEVGSTHLHNSTANGLGFQTTLQPNNVIWGDSGGMPSGATRFFRFGTDAVTANEPAIRLSDQTLVWNLTILAVTAPGAGKTDTWTVRKNGVDTLLVGTLSNAETSKIISNVSVTFSPGDTLSLKVVTAGATAASDIQVTVDMY